MIGNSGTNAASYTIYPDLKYTNADFAPIGLVAKTSPMIALKLDFPAKDLMGSSLTPRPIRARSASAMPASARRIIRSAAIS